MADPDMSPTTDQPVAEQMSRKRSASRDPSPDKRRRLSNAADDHEQRRPRKDALDERKRSKRLFGGLIGALARPATNSQRTVRGANSQSHTQAKSGLPEPDTAKSETLRRKQEELETRQKERVDALMRSRRLLQPEIEKRALSARHASLRARAGFLATKAEPILYYRPWELDPEEEARIKRQQEDVEADIANELDDSVSATRPGVPPSMQTANGDSDKAPSNDADAPQIDHQPEHDRPQSEPHDESPDALHQEQRLKLEHEQRQSEASAQAVAQDPDPGDGPEDAGEDTVMY